MNRFWMIGCALLTAVGCSADVERPDREAEEQAPPVTVPEVTIDVVDPKADALPKWNGHLADLMLPRGSGCEEPALIDAVDLDNAEPGEPIVTERFGPDGCVDERWVREYDGTLPTSEFYDMFDPTVGQYTYMQPYSYTHVWNYDEQSRVVEERRALEETTDYFFVERVTYDAEGRVAERTRQNNIWNPDIVAGSGSREEWEYHWSGEVAEHRVYWDNTLSYSERRVFDAAGNEIEFWVSQSGGDEVLSRRSIYSDGLLARVEVFGRGGNLSAEITHERRTDGTLARTVQMRHDLGYRDVYVYDEAERELEYTQDSEGDELPDYLRVTRWDEDGNMTFRSTAYDFDHNRNPKRYAETRWTYVDGRVVEQVADPVWLDEGTVRRTRWNYIGDGHIATVEQVTAAGEILTERVTRVSRERILWEKYDGDRDGEPELVTVYRWNGDRRIETLVDADGDGIADSVEQWFYDAAGQLVEHRRDDDGDGDVDFREAYLR